MEKLTHADIVFAAFQKNGSCLTSREVHNAIKSELTLKRTVNALSALNRVGDVELISRRRGGHSLWRRCRQVRGVDAPDAPTTVPMKLDPPDDAELAKLRENISRFVAAVDHLDDTIQGLAKALIAERMSRSGPDVDALLSENEEIDRLKTENEQLKSDLERVRSVVSGESGTETSH